MSEGRRIGHVLAPIRQLLEGRSKKPTREAIKLIHVPFVTSYDPGGWEEAATQVLTQNPQIRDNMEAMLRQKPNNTILLYIPERSMLIARFAWGASVFVRNPNVPCLTFATEQLLENGWEEGYILASADRKILGKVDKHLRENPYGVFNFQRSMKQGYLAHAAYGGLTNQEVVFLNPTLFKGSSEPANKSLRRSV